jgi:hypothetical protein
MVTGKNSSLLSKKDKKIAEIVTLKIFSIFRKNGLSLFVLLSQRCLPIAQAPSSCKKFSIMKIHFCV